VVVIVGRPNVGKSSFLNRVAGRRISIVEETPGVTRDRVSAVVQLGTREVELVDTGGIGIVDSQDLGAHVEEQIHVALQMADVIVFLVDVRDGIVPLDQQVAEELRRLGTPTVLVANKADTPLLEEQAGEFHALGLGEVVPMSIHQSFNTTEVCHRVEQLLPPPTVVESPGRPEDLRIAIVGKRNAGKSTFVNALAREERVIVSEIPGTTRDAVDVQFEKDGQRFVAVDTAGLRRRKAIQGNVEFYAQVRTERALRQADVILLLLDAPTEISGLERKLGEMAIRSYRPVVLVVNKWDLAVGRATTEAFEAYVADRLTGLHFSPLVFTTATTGRNVWRAVEVAQSLHHQAGYRVATGVLNRVLQEATTRQRPFSPRYRRKTGKILYGTQVGVRPPTFLLWVNDRRCFEARYLRFLANHLRASFPISEIPLRLELRERGESGATPQPVEEDHAPS
jgi:GTP-binding protein